MLNKIIECESIYNDYSLYTDEYCTCQILRVSSRLIFQESPRKATLSDGSRNKAYRCYTIQIFYN